jgi:hypothetical protein
VDRPCWGAIPEPELSAFESADLRMGLPLAHVRQLVVNDRLELPCLEPWLRASDDGPRSQR